MSPRFPIPNRRTRIDGGDIIAAAWSITLTAFAIATGNRLEAGACFAFTVLYAIARSAGIVADDAAEEWDIDFRPPQHVNVWGAEQADREATVHAWFTPEWADDAA